VRRGSGNSCSCTPSYQAQVWSPRDRKPIRKTFATITDALTWRQETQVALRRGTMRAPTTTTLADEAQAWLTAAEAGIIRTRSGDAYKPSALRTYRHALHSTIVPRLGHRRLSAITRNDLQDLVDNLVARGCAPSTVRNAILPVRAIYRRARDRDQIAINPTRKTPPPRRPWQTRTNRTSSRSKRPAQHAPGR
jgi:integrase